MSMEKDYIIHDTHSKNITALASNLARREIFLGFEDGVVKSIEVDTGKHVQTYVDHKGWVTAFLYWPLTKLLFSAANDSVIVIYGAGGNIVDKIFVGTPVYSMSLNNRRKEIVFGVTNGLQFHKLNEYKDGGHYIDQNPSFIIHEHTDIVRCVLTSDSRIYSAGYDGALVVYDCHYTGAESAIKCFKNRRAHDAGISCLLVEKDNIENNTWLVTGSFDKTLKIWTNDGKLIHKFDGFITSVTGVCYVPKNKTVWCVAGTNAAYIYDPKSGENVTDFIDTFLEQTGDKYYLQIIKYLNDFNILVTTTSRKQLIVYKYNPYGCLTSIKYKKSFESICFTNKVPILIFTGDTEEVVKWEQTQSNQLIYNSERLIKSDNVARESSRLQGQNIYSNQDLIDPTSDDLDLYSINKKNSNKSILRMHFVEKLDLILAACEDSCIYVWGFDDDAVHILKNMKPVSNLSTDENEIIDHYSDMNNKMNLIESFASNNSESSPIPKKTSNETDSVTNRVAGFKLKKVLNEHTSCVTSLAVIENHEISENIYLISAGWDRRICIWDLDKLCLFDVFRNKNSKNLEDVELASDGNILDICYCPQNNCFAYASTDSMCYIRKFSIIGSEMVLFNTLQGHNTEINCIKWNEGNNTWVTGGEDCTLRIWSEQGDCIQIINCGGTINVICIDSAQGSIIVGSHDTIKIYETEEYRLVQTNVGHIDSIRDIILIADRGYFVSVSWDKTMKMWRAWRKPNYIRKKTETNEQKMFETWVWEKMKLALKDDNSYQTEINDLNET